MDQAGNLDIASLAYVLQTSKLFPDIATVSQGIVKIQVGRELGIGPMQAVMGVHIIRDDFKNRTSIMVGAHLVAAKIKGSGRYDYDVLQLDPAGCELQPYVKRGDEWKPLKRISFTLEEAIKAGYGGYGKDGPKFKNGSNWAKDPQSMCFARAITRCEKVHFADLTGLPVYTPDELGYRVTESGEPMIIKGQVVPDDMAPEEEARLREAEAGTPKSTNGTNSSTKPRAPVSGVGCAKLLSAARDHGWPMEGMLWMLFSINGYVDGGQADLAWNANANQRLLELIAEDTFIDALKAIETESYSDWVKRTNANAPAEAEQEVEKVLQQVEESNPNEGKFCVRCGSSYLPNGSCSKQDCQGGVGEYVTNRPADMSSQALEAGAVEEVKQKEPDPTVTGRTAARTETAHPKPPQVAPKTEADHGEREISPQEYDDLWAMIFDDPGKISRTRAFAKQLGYSMLRNVKKKDFPKLVKYVEQHP